MANNTNSQAADNAAMEELKKKLAEAEEQAKAAQNEAAEAAARAEAAEKKNAETEAQLQALQNPVTQPKADTVRIKIHVEKNGPKDDVQVFLNGRQYIIRRGVEVDVPRGVAEILANRDKMLEVINAFDEKHAQ